jgi:flagellar hook-length control protein FliK
MNKEAPKSAELETEAASNKEKVTSRAGKSFFAEDDPRVQIVETRPRPERTMHHGRQSTKLPADDRGIAPTKVDVTEGDTAAQVKASQIDLRESHARSQELATYVKRGAGSDVANLAGENVSPHDGGTRFDFSQRERGFRFDAQSQVQTKGPHHSGARSETIHLGGEAVPAIAQAGEQKNFSQRGHHETAQESIRAPFEVLWHDGAPVRSASMLDNAPPAAARATDWRPVIDHVAGEINGHIRIGKSEALIQLDPPELGKLQIDLRIDGDKLDARIVAEKHESVKLIETHLPELRHALTESRLEHVEVRVDSGSWGDARQQGQRHEAGDGRQPAHDGAGASRNNSDRREPVRHQPAPHESGRVSVWA